MRLLFVLLGLATVCQADTIDLIGVGTLPGTASDKSGLTGKQSDGTPHDRLGGHGSGIAYTGKSNEYLLVADRGPKDGATDYACRFHRMRIDVHPGKSPAVTMSVLSTTLLTTEDGKQLVGSLRAFDVAHPERSLRFDPEAIRVGTTGQIYIADEYGPGISEFNANGTRLRQITVPARYRPERPSIKPEDELPPKNRVGRQPNRGLESLATSVDGKRLVTLLQSPLLQDNALGKDNSRVARNVRWAEIDLADGKSREHLYVLDDPAHGTNEVLAITDHTYLVLERDSRVGKEAKCKRIYVVDTRNASDTSNIESFPPIALPKGVVPLAKQLFLDLLDPRFGIAGTQCPEKFEGLAFGPNLPDGRRLLLVTADNDFLPDVPFRVYAFAIRQR